MTPGLQPNGPEIRAFLSAIFRHADQGTYISLRAFDQNARDVPPVHIEGVPVGPDIAPVLARAVAVAEKTANGPKPAVFAPPVATFDNPRRARQDDVANGLALSVEVDDADPRAARSKLEFLLGPATIVVASGGDWVDPNTGELVPKVHMHWRLSEPTRDKESHSSLRDARWFAALLVGADRTAASPAHPLRWPGSWHTKRAPRLASIVDANYEAEIHLEEALERLQEVVEATGLNTAGPRSPGDPQAPIQDVTAALAFIPNNDVHWGEYIRIGLAVWRATGGSDAGYSAWAQWSSKSNKHDENNCASDWDRFGRSKPTRIGAGTIFFLAKANGWQGRGAAQQPPPMDEDAYPEMDEEAPYANEEPGPSRDAPKTALWFNSSEWEEAAIPPRPWVAPRFLMRGSVAVAAGMGSAGKSSLMVSWCTALALGLEHGPFSPVKPCRVINYNVEDDDDEQKRRFSAALRQFDRLPRDLVNRVYRCGPHNIGTLMERDAASGRIVFTQAWEELERMALEIKPDVVMMDPLVELHTGEENDNTAVRQVLAVLRAFAKRHDCAVMLIHHTRKGATAGDPDSVRGGGAIVGAARIVLTVTPMSEEEAEELAIPKTSRKSYFRVDSAKANYASAGEANWHELAGYELDNGDQVAAALPWTAPSFTPRAGFDPDLVTMIANDVRLGTPNGPYSARLDPQEERSVVAVFHRRGVTDTKAQKGILKELLAKGFQIQPFRSSGRNTRSGLRAADGLPAAEWIEPSRDAAK